MAADVRLWASAPDRNFGWIVIGDETVRQSAKSVSSRETGDTARRPSLTITYRLPGSPPASGTAVPRTRDSGVTRPGL
jgi:hypothetical protein